MAEWLTSRVRVIAAAEKMRPEDRAEPPSLGGMTHHQMHAKVIITMGSIIAKAVASATWARVSRQRPACGRKRPAGLDATGRPTI